MNQHFRILAIFCLVFCTVGAAAPRTAAAETITFERHVRPILKVYCLDCHGGGEKVKGRLDLRLRRFAVRGGKHGPALVPGDAVKSRLLERIKAGEMPPGEKKVPAEQIAVIERWIAAGALARRDEPEKLPPGIDITPEERAYWFYQPIRRVEPPKFTTADRVRTSIDAFVLAKLREKGLAFNPDADKQTLLRRASLDLTGLPPTRQEIDQFLSDKSEKAYERLIDRLLASPHYGERWGRHWLDVAGYADSDGDGTNDTPRPYAWKYRDYVIRSLNADKPLDRFVIEQLAGDELVPRPWTNLKAEQIELLTATGFLRTAPDGTTSGGAVEAQQQITDTIKIVSSALLGLTVGCAQCHDHKYDPIPQADHYRLRAVFEPAFDPQHLRRPAQRLVSLYTEANRRRAAAVEAEAAKMQADFNARQQKYVRAAFEKELEKLPAAQRDKLRAAFDTQAKKRTAEQKKLVAGNPNLNLRPGVLYQYNKAAADELKKLSAKIQAKRAEKPVEDFVAVLDEVPGKIPITHVFYRGDPRQPKAEVQAGDLTIAAPDGARLEIPANDNKLPTSGRRLAYARHLTSGRHPLFGRVLANRLWLHHFGRGIVDTPGDFGLLGQRPTHPELLDWLASEMVRQGWSLKRMHKLLMTSTVYRQSSRRSTEKDAVDADNALYGRYAVRRLEAETLRDRMLAASGRLDRRLFGPPVPVVADAVGQIIAPDDKPRRSVYLQVRRSRPVAFLTAFDAPAGELNCDHRISSTAAPQALMLMNSDFVRQQAGHFAARVLREIASGGDASALRDRRLALAWQLAYQRPIEPDESSSARRFLDRQRALHPAAKGKTDPTLAAWTDLCQQLLSSNELLYVD
ncbi:MAG TPA: PSD1 and planctomycete cytochrome C domain-containing protein [Gemmataceae bacterium]|nr:PSD1 and planctomycete cytochrome C domain-containing protein [Gemmataceae bacterium]